MKAKTIKQVLAKKHKEWVNTIDDQNLRIQVRKHTLITGGCIASMLLNEKVNDYDVYFTNRATLIDVVKYYLKKFCELNGNYHLNGYDAGEIEETDDQKKFAKYINLLVEPDRVKIRINSRDLRPATETGYEKPEDDVAADEPSDDLSQFEHIVTHAEVPDEKPPYRPVFISSNAITLANQIQLVIRFYGTPEEVHSNYDFEHCKCYWESHNGNLVLPASSLEALLTKELVYSGSKYPLASVIRTRKFIQRGFTINAGQYLKMALQLNDLDLRDLATLEDQLIGMDAAYFSQIMAAIPADRIIDGKVDSSYIITLINRFF